MFATRSGPKRLRSHFRTMAPRFQPDRNQAGFGTNQVKIRQSIRRFRVMDHGALTHCNFYCSCSFKGAVVKKISMLNKNIVHLIDDNFWNMAFKTETQADKVIRIIPIARIISIISIIRDIYQYIPVSGDFVKVPRGLSLRRHSHPGIRLCILYQLYTLFSGSSGSWNC